MKDNIRRYVGAAAVIAGLGLGYLGVFSDEPAAGYAEGDCVVSQRGNEIEKASCSADGAYVILHRVSGGFDCEVLFGVTAEYTETIGDDTATLCLGLPAETT